MSNDEIETIAADVSALSMLAEILIAKVIAGSGSVDEADLFVESLRRLSRRTDRFVADDDGQAPRISSKEAKVHERISLIVDSAVKHATVTRHLPAAGSSS